MSMTIPVAQMRLAREMSEAEQALDEALIRQSSLIASVITARRETGVGPFVAHDALLRIAKSQQALLEAGSNLARAHNSLLDVQRELGAGDECPPDGEREPRGELTIAA